MLLNSAMRSALLYNSFMPTPILATKLHIPTWQESIMPRPRLLEQLTAGLQEHHKLTLISAPAGYGKTTIVTDWIHSLSDSNPKIAWLALDEADNDLTRFFSYWLAAFQQAEKSIGEKLQPLINSPNLNVNSLLDELLNDLTAMDIFIIIYFEDYHVITNHIIHEALEYFLDHQPEQVHVVMTTRQDPPLPIPRLRARRQLTEVRARDLRFSSEETLQFFSHSMKVNVTNESARALEERTEGWAVGLQLAGLVIQNLSDPRHFIETFRGSHRYVLDYLAEEVIRRQEEPLRNFLIQTSILSRFNANLCCALTGRVDAQEVIVFLEEANLFVVPLDDDRIWYRFHRLFSDYLQTLLSKAEQITLYKKASTWHEKNNLIEDAVRYALASGDPEFTADVIDRALHNEATWSSGNLTMLTSWLDALPEQSLQRRPLLSLNFARILYLSGQFDLAEKRILQTEQTLKLLSLTPEIEELLALSSLYLGSIASVRGDFQSAIDLITFAQERIPQENFLAHARALFDLGLANEIADQAERAIQYYLQSSNLAQTAGVHFLSVSARCSAAQVLIKQGHLNMAEQTCQEAIQLTRGVRIPPLGVAWSVLGGISLERNDLARAEQYLLDGITLSRLGSLADDIVLGLLFLTRLSIIQNNSSRAFSAFQEANAIIQTFGIPRLSNLASAYLARLQLFVGQKQAAVHWAKKYQMTRCEASGDFEELTLVRVLMATGETKLIPAILLTLIQKAEETGAMQTQIEAMLLLGLYHQSKQELQSAKMWLEKSIGLAAPEGYARIFLDEGKPLFVLLAKARDIAPEFVDHLLVMSQPDCPQVRSPLESLPDPLSEQELRVLNLIVAGKSNREIAEELVISVGTAKWHVHNVLQKLGVNNRPQAIAAARRLGI